jgi:hypothetical protein
VTTESLGDPDDPQKVLEHMGLPLVTRNRHRHEGAGSKVGNESLEPGRPMVTLENTRHLPEKGGCLEGYHLGVNRARQKTPQDRLAGLTEVGGDFGSEKGTLRAAKIKL